MNNLEQLRLLVQTAKVLDDLKGSALARTARDKILLRINERLDHEPVEKAGSEAGS